MGEMADDARDEYLAKEAMENHPKRPTPMRGLRCTDPNVWERGNGSRVLLVDMTDDHLEAALHMMLSFRLAERKYVKKMQLSFYSKDRVLDFKLNQLTKEWNRRFKEPGYLKKITRKIFR